MRDESLRWQQILATGFATAADLLEFLEIPLKEGSERAEQQFATRVPRGFAMRMEKGNRRDPLLLQVLAAHTELVQIDDYGTDPLQEAKTNISKGLIHKYTGRVLLTVTGACAINCRYCFRRHFPYHENNPGRSGWETALQYIANDSTIHEVILSGGDPLLANNAMLTYLLQLIEAIPHVRTLRIHTRIPVVLPERIDASLCKLLNNSRLAIVVVLHANHANELSEEVKHVCQLLRKNRCHLLNQSVLLAGVNDDIQTLTKLSERLFACGILPYYLHLLDKVQGAAHFDVSEKDAKLLFQGLLAGLPGYLVPRLAREVYGERSKILIGA